MLIFGAIFSGNMQYDLAVQNKDGSDMSAAFIKALNSTDALKVHMIDPNQDADAYLKANEITGVLIIPQGFGQTVHQNLALGAARPAAVVQVNSSAAGVTNAGAVAATRVSSQSQASSGSANVTPAAVILKVDQSSSSANLVIGIVGNIASGFNSQITGTKQVVGVENNKVLGSNFRYIDFIVPGILGMTILTSGVLQTVGMQTQYRNKGILKSLGTTPLKKSEWIISKMLYQAVVVLISAALIIVAAKLVYQVRFVPDVTTIGLIFAGTICFTGLGMIIAHFVKDGDAANAAASSITMPMLFLSGTFIPIESMPDYLQAVAKVLPLTYLNYGLRDSMILGDSTSAFYKMCIVLIVGVVFLVIGTLITNWREDDNPALLRFGGPVTARKVIVTGVVAAVLVAITTVGVVSITQGPQPQQAVVPSDTIASVPHTIASAPNTLASVSKTLASVSKTLASVPNTLASSPFKTPSPTPTGTPQSTTMPTPRPTPTPSAPTPTPSAPTPTPSAPTPTPSAPTPTPTPSAPTPTPTPSAPTPTPQSTATLTPTPSPVPA
jgi:ABC-2 type transport system permease protein